MHSWIRDIVDRDVMMGFIHFVVLLESDQSHTHTLIEICRHTRALICVWLAPTKTHPFLPLLTNILSFNYNARRKQVIRVVISKMKNLARDRKL